MYIYDIPQEQEAFTLCGGKRAVRRSMEQLLFTQVMINIDTGIKGICFSPFSILKPFSWKFETT